MIVELSVEDLAIIRRVEVEFGGGFTALTGETGAGKSLLVDALELALGERADSELVRSGADRAAVSLALDLSARPDLIAGLREDGIEDEDGRVFLARTVGADGRSTARINGRSAAVGTLRAVGRRLVDLHGQHGHQTLIHADTHLGYLDAWIGGAATEARLAASEAFRRARDLRAERRRLETGVAERERRLDVLTFQIEEIAGAEPRIGELEEVEAEGVRLQNAGKLTEALQIALGHLADGESAALDAVRAATKGLDAAVRWDEALADRAGSVREAMYVLQAATDALREYLDGLEADPRHMERLSDRALELRRLRRKYGADEAAVLRFAEEAREEHMRLQGAQESLGRIAEETKEAEDALLAAASKLTAIRRERAEAFVAAVERELRELSMPNARLEVSMAPQAADESGADAVEFLFSANLGEAPRPLARIASGGELSRVMLALKIALAGKAGVPTLIFDEVDTGLGGREAATMGRKLRELGRFHQVLVISHLPQVAAAADAHFRIEKGEAEGRTASTLVPLDPARREEEIARMLAGEEVSDAARLSAREMLSSRLDGQR